MKLPKPPHARLRLAHGPKSKVETKRALRLAHEWLRLAHATTSWTAKI
jgi:hypothetical protein